ncbi:Asp23/Gls24 family envelope stress response protein [Streptomyces alfalfae]|uniref:Asp23/Gls24 family envelope stress response protein n=1 Tax=Streptomyces alfalfae TaxID=1642299 RepID=A0A1P8TMX0_9ACTN|nr:MULTISPECIES: Asp23/Gls24 family envelope stress response protein [Streptomyces]AYA19399.1 Asp23/Gls24 family envelope stress response protein [Streptomyces fradiae]APY88981.1 stress protein [Streptomyces alfalfae]QQC88615.1 Asp23/Gls24 family envelope stress response protein [Streptomyces alfalfae]QUI31074.1 Asp23/Gls24 family envelope stress response protein [Streptomyces alfalfae]RXX35666.1 Asp23/Gls24 family envelope stress response protein [Streptomyces alfalfae]
MTDIGQRKTSQTLRQDSATEASARGQTGRASGGGAPGGRGKTTIADGVVEKIAGLAARDVEGVHAMGGGLARTFGAVRDRVPGGTKSVSRGVKAEVGEVQTALDLEIVVEYGVSIADVARDVRENVVAAVERMTGLEVVEVNIAVSDVKLPDEEDEEPEGRLQ